MSHVGVFEMSILSQYPPLCSAKPDTEQKACEHVSFLRSEVSSLGRMLQRSTDCDDSLVVIGNGMLYGVLLN